MYYRLEFKDTHTYTHSPITNTSTSPFDEHQQNFPHQAHALLVYIALFTKHVHS